MRGAAAALCRWARLGARLVLLSTVWNLAIGEKVKNPVVKWGQRPDRLYLTIPLPDVQDPEIKIEEKQIYFKGVSRGEEYLTVIKLLRKINVTGSKHTANTWTIEFDLQKLRKEPCWKRLTRSTKTYPWLKKNQDRWYTDECQHAKELWREAYFSKKLAGEDPNTPLEDVGKTPKPGDDDPEKKRKAEAWRKTVEEFRSRAVPRTKEKREKKRRRRKASAKSEL